MLARRGLHVAESTLSSTESQLFDTNFALLQPECSLHCPEPSLHDPERALNSLIRTVLRADGEVQDMSPALGINAPLARRVYANSRLACSKVSKLPMSSHWPRICWA
jgi:hypothetical protein